MNCNQQLSFIRDHLVELGFYLPQEPCANHVMHHLRQLKQFPFAALIRKCPELTNVEIDGATLFQFLC